MSALLTNICHGINKLIEGGGETDKRLKERQRDKRQAGRLPINFYN